MPPQNSDPPSVLVVDDEQDLCDLYAIWLGDEFDVRIAYSGTEALETVDETVDVVLLDRRMPGLSGDEVLEGIRERGLRCRVAMVTAVEPDFDIVDLGFDDYLTKPISSERLHDIVESLVTRRAYDDRVQELFALETKRRVLETEKSDGDLAANEEYGSLIEEIDRLRDDLDERVQGFDDDDFRAAFLTLNTEDPHPESLTRETPDDRERSP